MGEHGFSYNLISNNKLVINALFTPDSEREEVTWIGALGILTKGPEKKIQVDITFTAVPPMVIFNNAELSPTNIGNITLSNGGALIHDRVPMERVRHPSVLVSIKDFGLNFTVRFMNQHLDLFWHDSSYQNENSHGLIG